MIDVVVQCGTSLATAFGDARAHKEGVTKNEEVFVVDGGAGSRP